jgi:cytoskeletal protein CcmA (bactofilin family)
VVPQPVTFLSSAVHGKGELSIKGDIEVASQFSGTLRSDQKVTFHADSIFKGNIIANALVIEKGAKIQAQLDIQPRGFTLPVSPFSFLKQKRS